MKKENLFIGANIAEKGCKITAIISGMLFILSVGFSFILDKKERKEAKINLKNK